MSQLFNVLLLQCDDIFIIWHCVIDNVFIFI